MFYPLLLFNLALASAIDTTGDESTTFSAWISLLVSRGVYVLLASLIALCFIVTTVRNKFEERSSGSEPSWAASFWKGANPYLSLSGAQFNQRNYLPPGIENCDFETLKDRFKEAEVTIMSLKSELDMANKAKIDLENTIELYERQKMGSEDELLRLKIDGALEIEAFKKEAASTERQLQITLEEKEDLTREIECLKREGRITESALRDQLNLTERLEKARSEIELLRIRMKDMKAERDLAVRLASDMIEKAKGVASRDSEQRLVIEQMIEAEVKRIRLEEDDNDKDPELKIELDVFDEMTREGSYQESYGGDQDEKMSGLAKSSSQVNSERAFVITESDLNEMQLGIGDSSLAHANKHVILTPDCNRRDESAHSSQISLGSSEYVDDDLDDRNRLVTGSPAFRAFLSSMSQSNNC